MVKNYIFRKIKITYDSELKEHILVKDLQSLSKLFINPKENGGGAV